MSLKTLWRVAPAFLLFSMAVVSSAQDSIQISDAEIGSGTVPAETVGLITAGDCDDKGADCGADKSCGCGADKSCDGGCGEWKLFPQGCGINIGGWVQAGHHNKSTGLFNTHQNRVNLHQFWLYAEREANGDAGWDWGFRGDVVYGVDAQNTQAFGNNPGTFDFQNGLDHGIYGWAIPQAYINLANGPLDIKIGHFFTLIGYEVVAAPNNFFYSHAFTMNNSEPFTHTGVLASYDMGDGYTGYAGWTLGWDTGFDQINQGNSYIGGFSAPLTESATLTFMSVVGNFGNLTAGQDGYMHSLVIDVALTDDINYVFQSDFLDTDNGIDDIGINQYLFKTINDCWAIGTRVEWWRHDGQSNYAATTGLNWTPCDNFRLRPEIRQQWVPATNFDETIVGVDAILTF